MFQGSVTTEQPKSSNFKILCVSHNSKFCLDFANFALGKIPSQQSENTLIGVDFKTVKLKEETLSIWLTGETQRFQAVSSVYYSKAKMVFLFSNVLEQVPAWLFARGSIVAIPKVQFRLFQK